ncbi:MAG: hypothetical protein C6I00_02645 [Nitratiruptor sp.]|nr:hypothetical protein [Nitratiruptor sp.]NPA82848.1 VWA domain-containing protein [Campylobacterota bacterium]
MRLLDPEFIPLMLLPSFLLLYLILTNKSTIERIFDPQILQKIKLDRGMSKRVRLLALFLALTFMIFALARPVYQKGIVEVERRYSDLVIALDISRSMQAKDLYPNRLQFAKRKVEELIEASENLAIGLIAFAQNAFIISPITPDKEALLYLLDNFDTTSLSMRGTNIAAALLSAKLLYGSKSPKNLLLVTDGGDQESFDEEIALAKEAGFKIHVLGVGTRKGAPLEEEGGGYLQDRQGNIVIVRLNEAIAQLAQATGGRFIQALPSREDIQKLLQAISGEARKSSEQERIVDQLELYPYLLVLALLFLFLALFDLPSKGVAFAMLLCLPVYGGLLDFRTIKQAQEAYEQGAYEAAVKDFEAIAKSKGSPESFYDLGNAYYKAKAYEKAIAAYNKVVTSDPDLAFRKLHNLGNSYFMLQKYERAIHFYEQALEIREDRETRANLELARQMLQRQRQKQEPQRAKRESDQEQEKPPSKSKAQEGQEQEEEGTRKEPANRQPQKSQDQGPITNREEKKWEKNLHQRTIRTLLYKAPIQEARKGGEDENPW